MCQPSKLTKIRLDRVAKLFEKLPNSKIIDKTIRNVISKFRNNKVQSNVYVKVVLINALYKTAIMDIPKLANHIFNKRMKIDKKLKEGDITVIDDIRQGHGIGPNGESAGERDFYSFATKYSHFHNSQAFPICDNRVIRLFTKVNKEMTFRDEKFTQKNLRDYKIYKSVIDSLANHLHINIKKWGYKKIDQGLWLWAKYLYNPESIKPPSILKKLESIITK